MTCHAPARTMVNLTIDGKQIEVSEEATVLEAARSEGIVIPTLCYHKALGPYGVCRLCIVEVEIPGREPMVTTSCNCRVSEGLVVETATPRIREMRKVMIDLLLSGTVPTSPLRMLAANAGVTRRKYPTRNADRCILCGLCVRVCRDSIRAGALGFAAEGGRNKVAERIMMSAERCIGCGTCAAICPVGAINVVDEGAEREIVLYGEVANTLRLTECEECGTPLTSAKFAASVVTRLDAELKRGVKNLCPECARRRFALALTGQFPVL